MSGNKESKKNALYYLEFLPIIENADEIWSLLTLLTLFWNDKFVQTQICHKLYSFKPVEVDYYLPQFCQLVIDRQADVSPVRNFLIDQCRRSSRTGLLSSFFYNAAAIDNVPSTTAICQQMILDIELAALSGNKNSEYNSYIDLYKSHSQSKMNYFEAYLRQQSQTFKESLTGLTSDQIGELERVVFNIINNPIESAASFIQGMSSIANKKGAIATPAPVTPVPTTAAAIPIALPSQSKTTQSTSPIAITSIIDDFSASASVRVSSPLSNSVHSFVVVGGTSPSNTVELANMAQEQSLSPVSREESTSVEDSNATKNEEKKEAPKESAVVHELRSSGSPRHSTAPMPLSGSLSKIQLRKVSPRGPPSPRSTPSMTLSLSDRQDMQSISPSALGSSHGLKLSVVPPVINILPPTLSPTPSPPPSPGRRDSKEHIVHNHTSHKEHHHHKDHSSSPSRTLPKVSLASVTSSADRMELHLSSSSEESPRQASNTSLSSRTSMEGDPTAHAQRVAAPTGRRFDLNSGAPISIGSASKRYEISAMDTPSSSPQREPVLQPNPTIAEPPPRSLTNSATSSPSPTLLSSNPAPLLAATKTTDTRIGFVRSTSRKDLQQMYPEEAKSEAVVVPEFVALPGDKADGKTTNSRTEGREIFVRKSSQSLRPLSLGSFASSSHSLPIGFAASNGPTLRKSTSLENVNASNQNPPPDHSAEDSPGTNPKPTPRTGGLTREHSLNQARMRPPANSLASRPNVPHFTASPDKDKEKEKEKEKERPPSPRSAPLASLGQASASVPNVSSSGASTARLNVETLNMKRMKSHQRHTSCPVDLGNYKVKCSMCGTAVDIESVVAHTKKCDANRLSHSGQSLESSRARNNSITQIHKKPLRGTELGKLTMLTQLVTDVVAIRSAGILGEEKLDFPALENEMPLNHLVQTIYESTKKLELVDNKYAAAQNKFSADCKLIHGLSYIPRIIEHQTLERKYKRDYFESQLRIVRGLTDISVIIRDMYLKTKELKNEALRYTLSLLNENNFQWTNNVYVPLLTACGTPYRILCIPPNEALCLNSKFRVPYLINIEVVNGIIEAQANAERADDSSSDLKSPREITSISDTTGSRWKSTNINIVDDYEEDHQPNKSNSVLDEIFGQDWNCRKEKLRQASVFGKVKGWDLISLIVKGGDDLRQEQLAMQLIQLFADIFKKEHLSCLQLRPYMVLATSGNAGFIETVHDAISIHGLKASNGFESLFLYFVKAYGGIHSPQFKAAQINFIESIAAYSLVLFLLQIKDRHNGNILITREGHVIHIDYGFMLTSSPANMDFEKSPFKLPLEMVEVMGGAHSEKFEYFKTLIGKGFLALRRNYLLVLSAVELMLKAGGGMTCFQGASDTISSLKARFKLELSEEECLVFCDQLVLESLGNWRSELYDNFQYYSNGIL